jgi:molybdopterin synthase catalytic subunit
MAVMVVIGPVCRANRGYGGVVKECTFDACKGVTEVAGKFIIRELVFRVQDQFIRANHRRGGLEAVIDRVWAVCLSWDA